jgi:hypothetical protein
MSPGSGIDPGSGAGGMYRISGESEVVRRGDDRRGAVLRAVVPADDGVDRRVVDRAVLFAVLAARFTVLLARFTVLLARFTVLLARFGVPEARRFAVAARRVVDDGRAAPRDDASRASF